MPVNKKWGDEEEDAAENETAADSHGVKERVKITVNNKGQKVKTTTKLRVKELKTKTPNRVIMRKNLPRFGDAQVGEQNVTIPSPDFVSIEHPDTQITNPEDEDLSKTLANFIAKQKQREMMQGLTDDMDVLNFDGSPEKDNLQGGSNTYQPPKSNATTSMPFDTRNDGTENTIRVSNLTKAVTEDDLRDLFDRFGRILRISLPKVEERDEMKTVVKVPRGFAYIAFARHDDAEKAIEMLQGYGYDHLILKLEWAKPTRLTEGGGGGGMNPSYMSGYGTKLAQDTTQQVTYHSHGRQV